MFYNTDKLGSLTKGSGDNRTPHEEISGKRNEYTDMSK